MNQYGSSFEGRIKWEFYHNMVWSCRLFYFTNYDHVQGDMENTFDFILNRFFSTRLFVHLRYDDARALNKDFGHFQLKELLSFDSTINSNENQTHSFTMHRYTLFLIDKR